MSLRKLDSRLRWNDKLYSMHSWSYLRCWITRKKRWQIRLFTWAKEMTGYLLAWIIGEEASAKIAETQQLYGRCFMLGGRRSRLIFPFGYVSIPALNVFVILISLVFSSQVFFCRLSFWMFHQPWPLFVSFCANHQ